MIIYTCGKHNYSGIDSPCPDCKPVPDVVGGILRAIVDDIEFGYTAEMIKNKIKNGSYQFKYERRISGDRTNITS